MPFISPLLEAAPRGPIRIGLKTSARRSRPRFFATNHFKGPAMTHTPTRHALQTVTHDEPHDAFHAPSADDLAAYTGYYQLEIAKGAFLSIDTTIYRKAAEKITMVSITVSMDGTSSVTHPMGSGDSFHRGVLNIPALDLHLLFTRTYSDGIIVTCSGKVKGQATRGSTHFNPIPLNTFIGTYWAAMPKLTQVLTIAADKVSFDFGSGLQEIQNYSFTPLMFVLAFSSPQGERYTLMMGTAGKYGLACFIEHGTSGVYAVSIPMNTD